MYNVNTTGTEQTSFNQIQNQQQSLSDPEPDIVEWGYRFHCPNGALFPIQCTNSDQSYSLCREWSAIWDVAKRLSTVKAWEDTEKAAETFTPYSVIIQ